VTQPLDRTTNMSPRSTGSGSSSEGGEQRKGQTVCKWGRGCRRSDCWFLHPEGRNNVQDSKKDKSDTRSNASDSKDSIPECECCGGDPFNCQTPACVEQGVCGCSFGLEQEVEEDEAWKDEWFPASADCKCCSGYVYKCTTKQPVCESGECFCLLAMGQSGAASPKSQAPTDKAAGNTAAAPSNATAAPAATPAATSGNAGNGSAPAQKSETKAEVPAKKS